MAASERREYFVGVVVTLFVVMGFLLTATTNRRTAESDPTTLRLTADFAQADGLHVGSPVRLAGVTVGDVASITLDERYRAVATLRLTAAVDIPSDTSAAIETEGIFGAKYIELVPGGAEDHLATGGHISYTQDSVIIEDLIATIVQRAESAADTAAAPANEEARP